MSIGYNTKVIYCSFVIILFSSQLTGSAALTGDRSNFLVDNTLKHIAEVFWDDFNQSAGRARGIINQVGTIRQARKTKKLKTVFRKGFLKEIKGSTSNDDGS